MKKLPNTLELIDIIAENAPLDIEEIISLKVNFRRNTFIPVLQIRYYDKNKKCKVYNEQLESGGNA